jgi:hypothetical protein
MPNIANAYAPDEVDVFFAIHIPHFGTFGSYNFQRHGCIRSLCEVIEKKLAVGHGKTIINS